eukprot:3130881-Pleurochrysis_carterae.AAC.3
MALQAILILYRALTIVTTIWAGGKCLLVYEATNDQRSGARAQARGLGAPTGRVKSRVAHGQRQPSQA